MNVLFINGSPNKNGNTAELAEVILKDTSYDTLNLVDYKLYSYGQKFYTYIYSEIYKRMENAELIILGSPVYWHNMSGAVRNLLDRFYGPVNPGALANRKLVFVFQGAAPEAWMLEKGEYTIKRFAKLYGMEYIGMVTNKKEAEKLSATLMKEGK